MKLLSRLGNRSIFFGLIKPNFVKFEKGDNFNAPLKFGEEGCGRLGVS
jgi:hypothetical protein